MLLWLAACFLSLLASTSAFPFSKFFSHNKDSINLSLLVPRQTNTSTDVPLTITGDIPPIQCATAGRTVNYSADQIKGVITSATNTILADLADPANTLGSPSAGIDPAQPPTFALGCDAGKPMFWAPMNSGDTTDIVVMNIDTPPAAPAAGFCAVMTNADEPADGKGKYHVCNATPPQ